jgi:hypothetical protein
MEGSCDHVNEVISKTFMAAEVDKIFSGCQPFQLKCSYVSGTISALIICNQLAL